MLYLGEQRDLTNIIKDIKGIYDGLGIPEDEYDIDSVKIDKIQKMLSEKNIPNIKDFDLASPFKKAARFFCYFTVLKPLSKPYPPEYISNEELLGIHNHQNIIAAFHLTCLCLLGAEIDGKEGKRTLSNPIALSTHSYIDLIKSCTPLTESNHKSISVLLEHLAYRSNPDASYTTAITFDRASDFLV